MLLSSFCFLSKYRSNRDQLPIVCLSFRIGVAANTLPLWRASNLLSHGDLKGSQAHPRLGVIFSCNTAASEFLRFLHEVIVGRIRVPCREPACNLGVHLDTLTHDLPSTFPAWTRHSASWPLKVLNWLKLRPCEISSTLVTVPVAYYVRVNQDRSNNLLVFLLLVFWCHMAVAARELGPRESVILSSPTTGSSFSESGLTHSLPFCEPLPSVSTCSSLSVPCILPGTERLQHPRGR